MTPGGDEPTAHTRFVAPSPSPDLVPRPSVLRTLSDPHLRVVVLRAPGGYGKTSHVAVWLASETRPAAWIDLHEGHNDPHELFSALGTALAEVGAGDVTGLLPPMATPVQLVTRVAPRLASVVAANPPFVLVLDDAHLVDSTAASDLLEALLRSVPAGSTVVVTGRAASMPWFSRIWSIEAIAELGPDDLALDLDGVVEVLRRLDVAVDSAEAEAVLATTEGWPVGVRLAALARRADHPLGRIGDIEGTEPHISEYLLREWSGNLQPDDRDFLLNVSPLDWLSGPLCNRVLERTDSGEVLHRIHSEQLALVPLDHREGSYRMHRLLKDALVAQLQRTDPDGARLVMVRACDWYESAGDIDRAVQLAVEAGEIGHAERLVMRHAPAMHVTGRYQTIARWLDGFPRERVVRSAALCLCGGMAALGMGESAAMNAWVRLADAVSDEHVDPTTRLQLDAFRSVMSAGPVTPARAEAERAYRGLPPGTWHVAATISFGIWTWCLGNDGAEAILSEAVEEASIHAATSLEANSRALLAALAYWSGDIATARSQARASRRVIADHQMDEVASLVTGIAMNALMAATDGDHRGARDDIRLARHHLAYLDGVAGWTNVLSRLALCRASMLLGDRDGASVLLHEVTLHLAHQPDDVRGHALAAELGSQLTPASRFTAFGPSSLSTAEMRVLHYLPTNLSLADIGSRLYISRFTVKSHCASIYRKLGVSSRGEAVELARATRLLPAAGDGYA